MNMENQLQYILTQDQVTKLKELFELATSGPWRAGVGEVRTVNTNRCIARFLSTLGDYELEDHNIQFIVAAYNCMPALIQSARKD